MSKDAFKQMLLQAVGLHNKDIIEIFICNVDAVDENAFTCDCTTIGGDAPIQIPAVQLLAEVNDGVLYVPAIDSTVIIALSTRNKSFVILTSAVSKILFVIKNGGTFTTFEMSAGLIKLNDGSFDGLVKVVDLVTKLNNLENTVNALISKYNVHAHTGVSTGSSASGPPAILDTDVLTPTVQADLENTEITHGI